MSLDMKDSQRYTWENRARVTVKRRNHTARPTAGTETFEEAGEVFVDGYRNRRRCQNIHHFSQ
jgi:hypothetical protein